MGKIFDALERHKKEKSIKAERLPMRESRNRIREVPPKPSPAPESFIHNGFSPKLLALSAPDSLDAENFKILRSQILFPKNGKRPRTIMVTSVFPGEGKTFLASNLAVSIALGINEYVLLIDCDLRKPNIHKIFGYSNVEGVHEYITGRRELPDLLIRTSIDKLTLLTSGSSPPNPSELLSSTNMREFLEEARDRYQDRFIIIDAPPSQVAAEASVLAKYVDGIILVVMAQKSPRETIQRAIDNLGRQKILGIVFNGYSRSYKGYQKYYKKYYR